MSVEFQPYVPDLACPYCGVPVVAKIRYEACHYSGCIHATFEGHDGQLCVAFDEAK